MSELNRRTFIYSAAGAAAAASAAARVSAQGPNDTIRAAVLGVNGRGKTHIGGFMGTKGVKVAVLCDPDQKVLAERAEKFASEYGYKPETETDLPPRLRPQGRVDVVGARDAQPLGTPWRRYGLARRARTSTSRSRGATISTKGGRWSRRP